MEGGQEFQYKRITTVTWFHYIISLLLSFTFFLFIASVCVYIYKIYFHYIILFNRNLTGIVLSIYGMVSIWQTLKCIDSLNVTNYHTSHIKSSSLWNNLHVSRRVLTLHDYTLHACPCLFTKFGQFLFILALLCHQSSHMGVCWLDHTVESSSISLATVSSL